MAGCKPAALAAWRLPYGGRWRNRTPTRQDTPGFKPGYGPFRGTFLAAGALPYATPFWGAGALLPDLRLVDTQRVELCTGCLSGTPARPVRSVESTLGRIRTLVAQIQSLDGIPTTHKRIAGVAGIEPTLLALETSTPLGDTPVVALFTFQSADAGMINQAAHLVKRLIGARYSLLFRTLRAR